MRRARRAGVWLLTSVPAAQEPTLTITGLRREGGRHPDAALLRRCQATWLWQAERAQRRQLLIFVPRELPLAIRLNDGFVACPAHQKQHGTVTGLLQVLSGMKPADGPCLRVLPDARSLRELSRKHLHWLLTQADPLAETF